MKLLIRRNQRSGGVLGKPVFMLSVRAEISSEEHAAITKYKMGATVLYDSAPLADRGSGLLGLATRMAHHAVTLSVTVNDLVEGKFIECKDVVELLAIEEQLREAAKMFAEVLNAARNFGGEEVVELA